jgi:hypothetical protein
MQDRNTGNGFDIHELHVGLAVKELYRKEKLLITKEE